MLDSPPFGGVAQVQTFYVYPTMLDAPAWLTRKYKKKPRTYRLSAPSNLRGPLGSSQHYSLNQQEIIRVSLGAIDPRVDGE
jgi:hypothetical protein